MHYPAPCFELVVIGGGPGGIAPLLAAHRVGQLDTLLAQGVALVEQGSEIGSGTIGTYAINSDSTGHTFVDCLTSCAETALTRLANHPLARRLDEAGEGAVALAEAGAFLGLVGEVITGMIERHPASRLFTRHRAVSARQTETGWQVLMRDLGDGGEKIIAARNVLIATGAHQPIERLERDLVAGVDLSARYAGRLVQSDAALSPEGLDAIDDLLGSKASPHVAIVGGSTSALSLAVALLNRMRRVRFGEGGITLLHRRPLRVYYPDTASALADGYTEWDARDVCPISGRVFRFAGFRLESRELVMQARGIAKRAPEPRLRLHRLRLRDGAAVRQMDAADLVVAALGYRPRGLSVLDRSGAPIPLLHQTGWQKPMVDEQCRIVAANGEPLPGLFGMGLAAGYLPRGRLGGEPSFQGQANGLWLWQTDVGALIVNAVIRAASLSTGSTA